MDFPLWVQSGQVLDARGRVVCDSPREAETIAACLNLCHRISEDKPAPNTLAAIFARPYIKATQESLRGLDSKGDHMT